MDGLKQLLDKAKAAKALKTDGALADALKVSPGAVSNWRHGKNLPDAVQCAKLAEMSGEPLARVLGMIGEARAISREEKAVWRRLATAASVALALAAHSGIAGALYIMSIPHRWLSRGNTSHLSPCLAS